MNRRRRDVDAPKPVAVPTADMTSVGVGPLPADLRAELRRLLANMLVEDMRAYPTLAEDVRKPKVMSLTALDPAPLDSL